MGLFTDMKPTTSKPKTCRNLNPKTDRCGVSNPINCTTKKKCQFGHSITNSKRYQQSVGCEQAKCEFDRTAKILKDCYGVKIKKPFKCRV